nr:DUF1573 domain-containing protein [uncultured Fluviicola sp.]
MKIYRVYILITSCLLLGFKQGAHAQETTEGPQIFFPEYILDYGEFPYEGKGDYNFEFKNTGTEPLIIQNVGNSCSCTLVKWPTEPVAPGKISEIKIHYDTKRVGPFTKSFTVFSNAANSPVLVLKIKGNVLPAKEVSLESAPDSTK